ncbi:Phosphoenolpyruvate-protein phosphotransferase [Phycisphaerae bacterium RAS1]|nr:Phosphoenolpyruvate-protein phosphotransferase [Phycisphaerae bacterium RAS1]
MITKKGINASPGVAIGPALVFDTEEYRIPRRTIDASTVPQQVVLLDEALSASRQEVNELRQAAARKLGEQTALIFAFHETLIADPSLRARVVQSIEKNSYTAAYAYAEEMRQRQKELLAVRDAYLRDRVRDLYDIEKRVLRNILGRQREDITRLTEPVIIIANDITPSQAVSLDRQHVLGFAANVGGQTSHLAIIARQLGIPAVLALNDITADISGGDTIIVDGTHGIVVVKPDVETTQRYSVQQKEYERIELALEEIRYLPSMTQDNVPIALWANIEIAEEAGSAMNSGAEGVGLYRTEFMFLASKKPPTEEQQYETLRKAIQAVGGRPFVVRTIDLGADKMMDSMAATADHNPVLGLRSLRYCLTHLDMFKTHLRAILRASAEGDVRIMFPMISNLIELRQAKAALADAMEDLEEEGLPFRRDVPIGMMVETPSAALLASRFTEDVSFLSIGTNDLTQYTLAVDRANERVAHLYSPHNPAVLKLIRDVCRAGRRANVDVNLCGEMGGSPLYVQPLIGMGLRRLSMSAKDIPEIKKVIRSTTIERCRQIARKAMSFGTERQVLNFLKDAVRELDPGAAE